MPDWRLWPRPISVLVRGTLARVLGADQLDAWCARTPQKPYTRTVLFSTVYDILSQVVFWSKPSVRAAYQDHADQVGALLIALHNQLNRVEPHTSAACAFLPQRLPAQRHTRGGLRVPEALGGLKARQCLGIALEGIDQRHAFIEPGLL